MMLSNPPRIKPKKLAHGLIVWTPKTKLTREVPIVILSVNPTTTQEFGTNRPSVSVSAYSLESNTTLPLQPKKLSKDSKAIGSKETNASAHIIAKATHKIHPRAPVAVSLTGPAAHPERVASGLKIAQPTNMPFKKACFEQNSNHSNYPPTRFMLTVVENPIIMPGEFSIKNKDMEFENWPWPTYERLGEKNHNHSLAMSSPKMGIANITGKK